MLRAIVLFCLAALAAGFQAPLASQVAVRSAAATSPAVYMGARKAAPKRKVAPKKKVARKVQLTPRYSELDVHNAQISRRAGTRVELHGALATPKSTRRESI